MTASLDRSVRTSTPHVIDLVFRDGRMLAVCRCGMIILSAPAEQDQHRRAENLKLAVRHHFQAAACTLLCLVAWSLLMLANAKAVPVTVSQLSRMSEMQMHALGATATPQQQQRAVAVPIRSLPASTQYALVASSPHQLCRTVAARLRSSTCRPGHRDFETLRALGVVERSPGSIWHVVTDEGRQIAINTAAMIARELGLHETWIDERSYRYRIAHCTCGWSASLYSGKLCNAAEFDRKIAEHLSAAARSEA